ncbi:MAG TPA: dihydroorotate dehydrogenase [Gemmatimonadaceae bacterium]|nr:dihydroorotate dehydrogenase [Gemmatimonadaceae bacterium]
MSSAASTSPLAITLAGVSFQNPVLLAAGTAAYGRELAGVIVLDALGGLVTKAVSPLPRAGWDAPRVADFPGGMINAVGLANPGLEVVREVELPWLAGHVERARVIVNVVGDAVEDYATVVRALDPIPGAHAFELNVSCPNVRAGGVEFGADPCALAEVVQGARAVSSRPLIVKLSPTLPDLGRTASIAVDAGADAISVINTIPGLVIDVERRRPVLGFGTGGVSGPGLVPVGVLATHRVRRAVNVPVIGVGGIATANDALQYLIAGASLVAIGTAALRDPRLPERIVKELGEWCERHGVRALSEVVGTLEWP